MAFVIICVEPILLQALVALYNDSSEWESFKTKLEPFSGVLPPVTLLGDNISEEKLIEWVKSECKPSSPVKCASHAASEAKTG